MILNHYNVANNFDMHIKEKKLNDFFFHYLHLPYIFHNTENKNRVGYALQKKFLRWEKTSEGLRLNERFLVSQW